MARAETPDQGFSKANGTSDAYLLAGGGGEIDRLVTQSKTWEPRGERLLAGLEAPGGCAAVDIGCGPGGWLKLLSRWAGPQGSVVGTDTDPGALEAARRSVTTSGLGNVEVVRDDLFNTGLPAAHFDLVHSRFMLAPLGRAGQQVATYLDLLKPGGWLILEEPDSSTWRYDPVAPAADQLISLIRQVFAQQGGDLDAGTSLADLCHDRVDAAALSAATLTLPPGHPYQQAPLHFADSLAAPLARLIGRRELTDLKRATSRELTHPHRWGITFTLIQLVAARRPEAAVVSRSAGSPGDTAEPNTDAEPARAGWRVRSEQQPPAPFLGAERRTS